MPDFTNVLTAHVDAQMCEKMLAQLHKQLYDSGPLVYATTTDRFLAAVRAQLDQYPGKIRFEQVDANAYLDPQQYVKVRHLTTLMTYEQTGAQLEKEIRALVFKLQKPRTVGAFGVDFINGRLIFIVLYIKQPFALMS